MMMESDNNVRNWGMFCHLAALSGLFSGIGFILGPLIVWLVKRNEIPFVDDQGKEAVNFQLTMHLVALVAGLIAICTCGLGLVFAIPVWAIVGILDIILPIIGAIQASSGQCYRYPLTIRFIN